MADLDGVGADATDEPGDPGTDPGSGPGPAQGAQDAGGAMTGADTPPAREEPAFFDPAQLPDELKGQWKNMQGAYTKRMQGLRSKEKELGQLGDKAAMVDKFWSDPQYALQVIQQIAPQLGFTLSRATGTPGQQGTPAALPTSTEGITSLLTEKLGPDLAFLAPALAPAIEHVVQQSTRAAVAPLEHRAVAQTQAHRQQQEDALMAELDTEFPGWEEQYGTQMQELDAFLASDALSHPQFGSKYQVYLKLLNPSAARLDAVRSMQQAGRNRVGTGRVGRPAASNVIDQIRKTNLEKGWNEAWQVAIQNVDALAEELGR